MQKSTTTTHNIRHHLLPFILLLLCGVFALAGKMLWEQHLERLNAECAERTQDVEKTLKTVLSEQVKGLSAVLHTITKAEQTREGLRNENRDQLLARWSSLYEILNRESHLTTFMFFDTQRVCFLRVNYPQKYGERFDRVSLLEAERTGKTTHALELEYTEFSCSEWLRRSSMAQLYLATSNLGKK